MLRNTSVCNTIFPLSANLSDVTKFISANSGCNLSIYYTEKIYLALSIKFPIRHYSIHLLALGQNGLMLSLRAITRVSHSNLSWRYVESLKKTICMWGNGYWDTWQYREIIITHFISRKNWWSLELLLITIPK